MKQFLAQEQKMPTLADSSSLSRNTKGNGNAGIREKATRGNELAVSSAKRLCQIAASAEEVFGVQIQAKQAIEFERDFLATQLENAKNQVSIPR